MNLNKKHIILGIIFMASLWVGNILYYQSHILKEPVFTKHYYDIPRGIGFFKLYYIDNINAERRVGKVIFPEISPDYFKIEEHKFNSDDRFNRLNYIMVWLPEDSSILKEGYDNKVITKAEVHFTDGTVVKVDLGRIDPYIERQVSEINLLPFSSSSGSNNQTGYTTFNARTDLQVNGIFTNFPDVLGDSLRFKINGKLLSENSFPLKLKNGESLKVEYEFAFGEKDTRRNYAYDLPFYISYEDSLGNQGVSHGGINYSLHFPQFYDISALKREGGIK